ncbi:MAG: hypothetical protein E5Y89_19870 [Mesorhizobium sp.]|nr:MAG: hypothetical protein E5Y89_19870 [Mesorhizobium sp.]
MARYVFRDGIFVDRQTGVPMEKPFAGQIVMPNVISDIPDYASPIDGRMITSRSERRDDLKRNNCVEYEPSLSPTKGRFRNPDFCKKRGLQVSEEFR